MREISSKTCVFDGLGKVVLIMLLFISDFLVFYMKEFKVKGGFIWLLIIGMSLVIFE